MVGGWRRVRNRGKASLVQYSKRKNFKSIFEVNNFKSKLYELIKSPSDLEEKTQRHTNHQIKQTQNLKLKLKAFRFQVHRKAPLGKSLQLLLPLLHKVRTQWEVPQKVVLL